MKRLLLAVAAIVMALGVPALVRAQVGSSTDIITGKVTGPNGEPVAGARIEVMSLETQVTRFRTTNEKGQYTLLYPDGGGAYRVTFKAIGMAPFVMNLNSQADEDRLEANAKMSPTSQRLGQIVVRAAPNPNANERPTAGSTEKVMTGEQLYRLPVDASDPALVASLEPGVILLGGSDSTANSFVIAGQRADQNQITLDGLSFGSGSVPSEAVRNTRVITNTYVVAGNRAGHVEPAELWRRRPVRAGPVVLVRLRQRERADERHQHTAQRQQPVARAFERRAGLGGAFPRQPESLRNSDLVAHRPERRPHGPLDRADAHGLRARRSSHADRARRLELDIARRDATEHALGAGARRRHEVAGGRIDVFAKLAVRYRHHQRTPPLLQRLEEQRAAVPDHAAGLGSRHLGPAGQPDRHQQLRIRRQRRNADVHRDEAVRADGRSQLLQGRKRAPLQARILRQHHDLRQQPDHEPARIVELQLAFGFRQQPAEPVHADADAEGPHR